MSALKHGLFRAGFMLCDRCVSNAGCERFTPKGRCMFEQEAFDKIVAGLTEEFELESLADRILVERATMYLVRIMRTEAYEATVGLTEKAAFWGYYISRLDNVLRGFFNDLAISRGKRKKLERGQALLVSLDEVLRKFARSEAVTPDVEKRRASFSHRKALLKKWKRDYPHLK